MSDLLSLTVVIDNSNTIITTITEKVILLLILVNLKSTQLICKTVEQILYA